MRLLEMKVVLRRGIRNMVCLLNEPRKVKME